MSDHYRALTRTYRPTSFDDIVSQTHVSNTLKNAIKQQRLAHAYMFCGPRGVGKTTMARVLARTVNSIDNSVDGEGLNQTLNIIEIDAASNNSVDDIRDLRERVRIPPQNGRYKIYIIDEVHMLSKSAFNALLKTLEQPPDHVIFIFATTEPHKVLPTILSRVQRFDFKRISVEQIVERLKKVAKDEGINIDLESLHVIAKKADGALRDALGLLDQAIAFCGTDIEHDELLKALNVVSTDRMFQFMDAVEANDASAGLELIDELLQEGYDIQEFLIGLLEHLRNLYVAKNSEKMHLVEASDNIKKRYKEASGPFTQDDLMRMMHLVSEAQFKIKDANQPRIQFEITLLKLIHMERTQNLNKLLRELDALKKKLSSAEGIDQLAERSESADSVDKKDRQQTSEETEEQKEADDLQPHESFDSESVANSVSEPDQHSVSQPKSEPAEEKHAEIPKAFDIDGEEPESKEEPAVESPISSETENTKSSVSENEATEQHQGKDEDVAVAGQPSSNFFGQPSLGNGRFAEKSTANGNNTAGIQSEGQEAPKFPKPEAPKKKSISLEEVKGAWDEYLQVLKAEVQQTLYFQMMRIEPVKIKNRELTLRCSNDFAKRIVDENKKELAKVLESVTGIFLRFNAVVHQTEQETEETKSPYERFRDLQERDPKIKMLVELFGAELDYNLNR